MLPDTIIVGAQRCGTSSLYRYLVRHPLVLRGLRKEVHYFNRVEEPGLGLAWYRSHFPTWLVVGLNAWARGASGKDGGRAQVSSAFPGSIW